MSYEQPSAVAQLVEMLSSPTFARGIGLVAGAAANVGCEHLNITGLALWSLTIGFGVLAARSAQTVDVWFVTWKRVHEAACAAQVRRLQGVNCQKQALVK